MNNGIEQTINRKCNYNKLKKMINAFVCCHKTKQTTTI